MPDRTINAQVYNFFGKNMTTLIFGKIMLLNPIFVFLCRRVVMNCKQNALDRGETTSLSFTVCLSPQ